MDTFAPLEPALLNILVCPVSRARLIQYHDVLVSADKETRRRYKIVDGIPNMIVEESEELTIEEWEEIMKQSKL